MVENPVKQAVNVEGANGTLPRLAESIKEWFPELEGRSLAVTEIEVTKENIPTLPICLVGLVGEKGNPVKGSRRTEPEDTVVVQFWMHPERYKAANGETPFWGYYDYEQLRNRLLTGLLDWKSPWGEFLYYDTLDIEADALAVVISFHFKHKFVFCPPARAADAKISIGFSICYTPANFCPEDQTTEESDPCQ